MNYFAVLDESDNEDVQQKKNNKPTNGSKAPAAAAKTEAAPKAQNSAKPQQKDGNKNAKPVKSEGKTEGADADASKEGARSGKPRNKDFRHGEELRGENKKRAEARDVGKTRAKRDFDRRSSTGRGREVSRGGRGAFGAGSAAQDALDAEKDPKSAEAATEGETAEETPVVEEPTPEEPPALSFNDFLAQRNESRAKVAAINERPIRTVTDADFAGLVAVERAADEAAKASQAQKREKDQRSTARSEVVDVAFKFQEIRVDSRDTKERGPRTYGGDRERAPRKTDKGPKGGNKSAAAGAVFNAADFPSL